MLFVFLSHVNKNPGCSKFQYNFFSHLPMTLTMRLQLSDISDIFEIIFENP